MAGVRGREVSYNEFGPSWYREELSGGFTKNQGKREKMFAE